VQDPSHQPRHANSGANLLGFPGAVFSDLAIPVAGLGQHHAAAAGMLLGWRLLSHRPVGEKWRGLLWILATSWPPPFVSTLPARRAWPLPTGLGGSVRDAICCARQAMIFGETALLGMTLCSPPCCSASPPPHGSVRRRAPAGGGRDQAGRFGGTPIDIEDEDDGDRARP